MESLGSPDIPVQHSTVPSSQGDEVVVSPAGGVDGGGDVGGDKLANRAVPQLERG